MIKVIRSHILVLYTQYLDSVEVFGVREDVQQLTVADEVQTREDQTLSLQVILRSICTQNSNA